MDFMFAQSTSQQPSTIMMFLPMALIFAVLYFMILRPQGKQRKKHVDFIENLKKGDKIITRGGVIGKIKSFQGKDNNRILLDAGHGTSITISRAYIAGSPESGAMTPKDNA